MPHSLKNSKTKYNLKLKIFKKIEDQKLQKDLKIKTQAQVKISTRIVCVKVLEFRF